MPSRSKAQQRFMGMVRAAQKGLLKNPSYKILKAAKGMKSKAVKDFASTKHNNLPDKLTKELLKNIIKLIILWDMNNELYINIVNIICNLIKDLLFIKKINNIMYENVLKQLSRYLTMSWTLDSFYDKLRRKMYTDR